MPATLLCPLCHHRYDDGALAFCPRDGARLLTEQGREDTLTGVVVQQRYRVGRLLGQGGMARVYEAEHLATGRKVALKALLPRLVSDPAMVDRFRHEAKLIALVAHPNVVAIEDFGSLPGGSLFMVMELLRGRSLQDILDERPIDPALALDVAVQVCDAAQALHERNIVHRDLKPANVHLQRLDGAAGSPQVEVKVLDFGISKLLGEEVSGLTRTGAVFGTPEYMSPEQAMGGRIDARADIYSIGVMLYRMLIGKVPFTADSFLAVLAKHMTEAPEWPASIAQQRGLSPDTERVVMKALNKPPELRFGSAAELAAALSALRKEQARSISVVMGLGDSTEVLNAVPSARSSDIRVAPLASATGSDHEAVELAPGTWWVGRRQGALLECNAYLRSYHAGDAQVNLLIDPGPPSDLDVIARKIASLIGSIANVDLLFLNHQDPDVAANAALIQQANPRAHVLCAEDTWRLAHFYGLKPRCYSAVEHFRDYRMHLATGQQALFVPTPFCHFRGAVMYYDLESRVLFSGDLFGGLSRSPILLSAGEDWDDIDAFHQLYMPTNTALRRAVERVRRLDPKPVLIAPQHGALIPEDKIEALLRRIETLPVGSDLDASDPETGRCREAANRLIRGVAEIVGRNEVERCLRQFAGDGTFPNLFVFGDSLTILEVKIEPRAAMRALMRGLQELIVDSQLGEFRQLVGDTENRYQVRLPVAAGRSA